MAVKKVTVFIDYFSKRNLEEQNIDVRKIFRLVKEKFLKQGIALGYDLDNLRIEYLPIEHRPKWYEPFLSFLKSYVYDLYTIVQGLNILNLTEEMKDCIQRELSENGQDLIVYFVSVWSVGNGFAIADGVIDLKNPPVRNANGKGLIVLHTRPSPHFKTKDLLTVYAEVLMHEQCHLYGLRHVFIPNTLMFPGVLFGSEQLDEDSKEQLLQALAEEDKK